MIMKYIKKVRAKNICLLLYTLPLIIFTSTVWAGDATKNKEIKIFIERQVLVAIENGKEIYSFDIVTGREKKETTVGSYTIFRKHKKYISKTYGSEMPYTMFFTKDGKAIHGTNLTTLRSYLHSYLTESVGSMGCVGMTDDNAKVLFE